MKKVLKILSVMAIVLGVGYGLVYLVYNEPLPEGKSGKKAEDLTNKMLVAINHDAFLKTEIIEWSFRGEHFYKWQKQKDLVKVKWGSNEVLLFTKDLQKSEVLSPKLQINEDKKELIKQANSYFNNDSFWLLAPHKIRDKGTERKLVFHEEKEALLVTYNSGGDTPGDSYLWILDENGLPKEFKMWISLIPVGGLNASWDSWVKTESGTLLPSKHTLFFGDLNLSPVKGI